MVLKNLFSFVLEKKNVRQIDVVHQKIGRNLLHYQMYEDNLKMIISQSNFAVPIEQIEETLRKRFKSVSNQTMGYLASRYVELIYNNDAYSVVDEDFLGVAVSFNIKLDDSEIENLKNRLSGIVTDRNLLVHHFPKLDTLTAQQLTKIIHNLDSQWDIVKAEIDYSNGLIKQIRTNLQYGLELLLSGEVQQLAELQFAQSELYNILEECYNQYQKNGWVQLSIAGKHLKMYAPKQLELLDQKYGYKTIKKVVESMGLFEIKYEGDNVLYRINKEQ